jgi:hypothetical protein
MYVFMHACKGWVKVHPALALRPLRSIVLNNNSVTLVRERTIPTERQPLVGEVSANFCK